MSRFRDDLRSLVPCDAFRGFSGRFDIIGDIAVITIPPGLEQYGQEIARAILANHHGIRTVVKKRSRIAGDYRTAAYEILTGTGTGTTHHENGFSYRLDLSTSFFTPRLAYERKRVTGQVKEGEQVLVLFAGVGPFVVPAAARGARVVAIEQNPDACLWLEENCRNNRVADRVTLVNGDAFTPSLLNDRQFDRAIVPAPYGRDDIFNLVAHQVKSGGMLHVYTFKNAVQSHALVPMYEKMGFEVLFWRRCGNVAPAVSRWVYDLRRR